MKVSAKIPARIVVPVEQLPGPFSLVCWYEQMPFILFHCIFFLCDCIVSFVMYCMLLIYVGVFVHLLLARIVGKVTFPCKT